MKPSAETGIKKAVLSLFFLISALLAVSPLLLNYVVNTSYVRNKISRAVLQKSGIDIAVSKISFFIKPRPGVKVENINFNLYPEADLTAQSIAFDIHFKKLIKGQISIGKISIIDPEIKLHSAENNKLASGSNLSLSQLIPKIKTLFNHLPLHQDSIEFGFENFTSPYFKRMDGSVYLSKKTKEIRLNTAIADTQLNLSDFLSRKQKEEVDINSMNIDKIACSLTFNEQEHIRGDIRLTDLEIQSNSRERLFDADDIDLGFQISDKFYQIDIKPLTLSYPMGVVEMHFRDNQQEKTCELQIKGRDININQAKKTALLMLKKSEITYNIFDILHQGTAVRTEISFLDRDISSLFGEKNFTLSGQIKNGLVTIPETDLTASDVKAGVKVENGILKVNADGAAIQGSKVKKGSLEVDLVNHADFPFKGKFALDIDLSRISQALISLLPETALAEELKLVQNVKGRADAWLELSMAPLSDDLEVHIQSDDFAVSGMYERIPGEINLQNINLNYRPGRVYLKNINGVVNKSHIEKGDMSVDFSGETDIKINSGAGVIELDTFMPWLISFKNIKKIISPVKNAKGKIHVASMEMSGPLFKPEKWTYSLNGRLEGIDLYNQLEQKESENISSLFHISDDYVTLNELNLTLNNLTWIDPFLDNQYANSILLPIHVKSGHLQIKKRDCFFNSKLKSARGVELEIDLKGKTLGSLAFNRISFHDENSSRGVIRFNSGRGKPPFEFKGFLNTITLDKLVRPESDLAKKITDLTKGYPVLIYMDKNNIDIFTERIDLNQIKTGNKDPFPDHDLLTGKIINLKTDLLKIDDLTLNNIDSRILLKKERTHIKVNKAFLCDIETEGYINFKNKNIDFEFPFKAYNKADIQDLLYCLFKKTEFMNGKYSLECRFASNSSRKEFRENIHGSIKLTAEDGRIYKFTLLSRILSLLNVSRVFKGTIPDISQKGFSYKTITIESDIENSIIQLNKGIIDGEDMTMFFTGWIDPLNDKINLTCIVAPFKTIDLIIEKIPIVNTVLGNRLISVPFSITGKFSNPAVIPMHPAAVSKGLLNMLSDILKTPVRLLDKLDEK